MVDFLLQLPFLYIQLLLLVDEALKGLLGKGVGLDYLDFRFLHLNDGDCLHILVFIPDPISLHGYLFLVHDLPHFSLHLTLSNHLLCLLLDSLYLPLPLLLSLTHPLPAPAYLLFKHGLLPPERLPLCLALLHLLSEPRIRSTEPLYVLLEVDLLSIVVTDEALEVLRQAVLSLG